MAYYTEYRVRAVTRYIVTRYKTSADKGHEHDEPSSTQVGEFDDLDQAKLVAEAMAHNHPPGAKYVPYEAPLPGKVMRCKVSLGSRLVNLASAVDEAGKPLGRTVSQEHEYRGEKRTHVTADQTDPANWRGDGEQLAFYAVCAGFDDNGVPNVEENRIFGYWSPSVEMRMTVRNQAVLDALEQGREYYVDFTPAPKS